MILADESVDFAVVRALREAGYDVQAVAETRPGISDAEVIDWAYRRGRVLLTEDKDFGQLVFGSRQSAKGVILLRYRIDARSWIVKNVIRLLQEREQAIEGAFVVITPGQARIRRKPS